MTETMRPQDPHGGGTGEANIGPRLKGDAGAELLRPAAENRLRMWPVSRRVNKTGSGDDHPSLLDEVAG